MHANPPSSSCWAPTLTSARLRCSRRTELRVLGPPIRPLCLRKSQLGPTAGVHTGRRQSIPLSSVIDMVCNSRPQSSASVALSPLLLACWLRIREAFTSTSSRHQVQLPPAICWRGRPAAAAPAHHPHPIGRSHALGSIAHAGFRALESSPIFSRYEAYPTRASSGGRDGAAASARAAVHGWSALNAPSAPSARQASPPTPA
jgi:hypothetical protein